MVILRNQTGERGRPMAGSLNKKALMQLLDAPVTSLGVNLIDVERVSQSKGGPKILRRIIDKRGGVSMDDCSAVSRLADPLIDSHPELSGHDYLEVSSPGLDRPLKTSLDLAIHQGEPVAVKLYRARDGQKEFQGNLAPSTEDQVVLDLEDGTQLVFTRDQVAKIQRIIQF